MSFTIRPAVPDDAFAACAVLRRSITECCIMDHRGDAAVLGNWLGNKTPHNVASWFAAASNHSLVAERDGQVVGVCLLTQAGKLSLCYVLPDVLHIGVGKALLRGAEAQARLWGISVMRLHSTSSARDFYARNGYFYAGKEKSCYGVECDFFWKKLDAELAPEPACTTADGAAARKRYCSCAS